MVDQHAMERSYFFRRMTCKQTNKKPKGRREISYF